MRSVEVGIRISDSKVANVTGTCLAGKSAYYNYVMILLLEVADYISSHMQHVPQEYLAQARQGEIKYHLEQTKKS